MIRLIHLSDLHIHGSNKKIDNINAIKIVDYIIDRYAHNQGEKPVALITVDISDDGKKNLYNYSPLT